MKQQKKHIFSFACLLLAALLCLSACGDPSDKTETTTNAGNEPQNPTPSPSVPDNTTEYTISVTDYFGNSMAGVKASIQKDGAEVKSLSLGHDGTEKVTLETGDYTVAFSGDEKELFPSYFGYSFSYDADMCKLSKDAPVLTVVLTQKANGREKLAFFDDPVYAYNVTGGAYKMNLSKGLNYFIFRPNVAGIYEISIGNESALIGNYGAPTWIHETPTETSENGVLTLEVSRLYVGTDERSTTPMVIGIDAGVQKSTEFMVTFKKVGELPMTPAEAPWTTYRNPNAEIPAFSLPEGSTLTNVDVFDPDFKVVFNESDGYYHVGSADGPLLLIRLTTESPYLADFFTICNTTQLGSYFYDENEKFLYKETYNELIFQYTGFPTSEGSLDPEAGVYDRSTGTYPMDAYLAHFMLNAGEYMGWWKPGSIYYRFADDDELGKVLTENAWLFACCYVAE